MEVVGDQLIRDGDCSVTWDSGSLEKSLENTWTTIDSIIDKVLDEPKDSESRVNPNEAHQME